MKPGNYLLSNYSYFSSLFFNMAKLLDEENRRLLDELKNFLHKEKTWLETVLSQLGWDINDLPKLMKLNFPKFELCPVKSEHRVPEDSLEAHVSRCSNKYDNYPEISKDVVSQCENDTTDDGNDKSSAPHLTLQEFSNDGSASVTQPFSSQCLIELLSAERDAKRRRAAYRRKRVHTNKKSYNEILRELIDNEMKTLESNSNVEEDFRNTSVHKKASTENAKNNITYAGVGNWIFHGNPYKRWITIEKEEEEFFKNIEISQKIRHDYSRRSIEKDRNSRTERRVERQHFDSHKDKRNYSSRNDRRYSENRRRHDYRTRRSSLSSDELSNKELTLRKSPTSRHIEYRRSKSSLKICNKYDKPGKSFSRLPNTKQECGTELVQKYDTVYNQNNISANEEGCVTMKKDSQFDGVEKSLKSNRRGSSNSDVVEKRKKKKKHKKHSKKKKKRDRSSVRSL